MIFGYIVLGVLAPIILNLIHLIVGIYVVTQRGNIVSLGFTGISLLTKSVAMIYFTWLGVSWLHLDFRVFVPLLFSFRAHISLFHLSTPSHHISRTR